MLRFQTFSGFLAALFYFSSCMIATTAPAQNFIGPRYPGEVIISERIVTPQPQRDKSQSLPAPKPTKKVTVDENGRSVLVDAADAISEPTSLSDGGHRRAELARDDIPFLAFSREVWERMLELERENARLEATLEYERRLATFREHSEDTIEAHLAEIEHLESEMKELRAATTRDLEESRAAVAEALRQVQTRSAEIAELQKQLLESGDERKQRIAQTGPKAKRIPATEETPEKKMSASKDGENDAVTQQSDDLNPKHDEPLPEPKRHNAKKKNIGATESEQPPILLTVLPIGFQLDPVSESELVQAAISSSTDEELPAPVIETSGLQGGALGPLGKNNEPDQSAEKPND
jgi:hypothetical protein